MDRPDSGFEARARSVLDAGRPAAPVGGEADGAGFVIKLSADLNAVVADEALLELPGAVELRLRLAGRDPALADWDTRQNYLNFPGEDGLCPVLEARVGLRSQEHPDWKEMWVGVPLSRLGRRGGTRGIEMRFTGARWLLRVDGLEDEDFPFGQVSWPPDAVWSLKSPRVATAALWTPTPPDRAGRPDYPRKVRRIQYFTPEGHNAWVGDVVTFFHDGRFHIFYLFDRRHHRSKFGRGGHYFAHLSSADLRDWAEHEPAVDLDEQWETCGTGTPFMHGGKMFLAYGLHTTRMVPDEATTLPLQREYLRQHGRAGVFKRAETPGYPAGSTYAASDDGIHFTKSQVMMHPCENPSVHNRPDGSLLMYAGYHGSGAWEARGPGGWVCVAPEFPPEGAASSMDNSTECQCGFEWNGWHYLLGGFSGFWCSPDGGRGTYLDLAGRGSDIYDGLGVPMVAAFTGNRRILAGWLGGLGWGGHLVLRELLQRGDGTLGMKWLEEALPPLGPPRTVVEDAAPGAEGVVFKAPAGGSLSLDMVVEPGDGGKFAVRLRGAAGGCELQLDAVRGRAQWNEAVAGGFAVELPSGREIVLAQRAGEAWAAKGRGSPEFHASGRNFCVEDARGMDKPFTLRLMVFHDPKMGGSVVDAEIAGQRTLVSCRPGLLVEEVSLAAESPGTRVGKVRISAQDLEKAWRGGYD